MKHGDILYKPDEKVVAEIISECFNKGPNDSLSKVEQMIVEEIVIAETTYYIDPEWINLDNPDFVSTMEAVMARLKLDEIENNKSWRQVSLSLWGYDPTLPGWQRNCAVVERLRKRVGHKTAGKLTSIKKNKNSNPPFSS